MELIKPQRRTNIFDYWNPNKKIKIIKEEPTLPKVPIKCLEDLSNELFYDIFNYLDVYHVYKGFHSLNQRLQSLLTTSTLPLKINLSSISKSSFQYYHRQILMPNKHRITILRLAHVFLPDLIFSPVRTVSEFTRLETLIFDHCKSKYLPNIIHHLASLSHLTSLVIISIDSIAKVDELYRAIFRLPVLKYCKVSLDYHSRLNGLVLVTNTTSSIEHLVLDHECTLNELDVILSCVPHLHRLSIQSLEREHTNFTGDFSSKKIEHLRHFTVDRMSISFNQFQRMSECLFTQLELLRLSINDDQEYLNAKQWEQMIRSTMPQLRIFDFQYSARLNTDPDGIRAVYDSFIEQFSTLFWMERQWFFTYELLEETYQRRVIFLSTSPYRRKEYRMHGLTSNNFNTDYGRRRMPSVDHLHVRNEKVISQCRNYFPKITKLTLSVTFKDTYLSLPVILKTILPLKQLTTLVIDHSNVCIGQLLKLLTASPNVHTLILSEQPNSEIDTLLKEPTESFRLLSERNKITTIVLQNLHYTNMLEFLVMLCPRMQRLTVHVFRFTNDPILQFILTKAKSNLQDLRLLCLKRMLGFNMGKLKNLIESEELLDNYSIRVIKSELYLWW